MMQRIRIGGEARDGGSNLDGGIESHGQAREPRHLESSSVFNPREDRLPKSLSKATLHSCCCSQDNARGDFAVRH